MPHIYARWPGVLFWSVVALVLVVVHTSFHQATISFLPWPFVAAVLIPQATARPWRFLLPIAVAAELLTNTPPLVMTAAIVMPQLLYTLARAIEIDFSFSFFLVLLAAASLSLGTFVILNHAAQAGFSLAAGRSLISLIPLTWLLGSVLSIATVSFVIIVAHREFFRPSGYD